MESDWKTYSKRVPQWRDRYLARRNEEIAAMLTDKNRSPTELFWDAREKMNEIAKILSDCLDPYSRSQMKMHLLLMHRHGLIETAELDEFSDELREWFLNLATMKD